MLFSRKSTLHPILQSSISCATLFHAAPPTSTILEWSNMQDIQLHQSLYMCFKKPLTIALPINKWLTWGVCGKGKHSSLYSSWWLVVLKSGLTNQSTGLVCIWYYFPVCVCVCVCIYHVISCYYYNKGQQLACQLGLCRISLHIIMHMKWVQVRQWLFYYTLTLYWYLPQMEANIMTSAGFFSILCQSLFRFEPCDPLIIIHFWKAYSLSFWIM